MITKSVNIETAEMDPAELRAIGFFHHKTAPTLSSYFDADFWTRLVFQMSYNEPAIRHAMVALGTLHEKRETGMKMVPTLLPPEESADKGVAMTLAKQTDSQGEQFALNQYNKAIMYLSKRLNTESSTEVALLACILERERAIDNRSRATRSSKPLETAPKATSKHQSFLAPPA